MVLFWIPERILQLLLLPASRLQYESLLTAEILAQHPEERGSCLFQFLLFSPCRSILQTGDKDIKLYLIRSGGCHPSLRQHGQPQ